MVERDLAKRRTASHLAAMAVVRLLEWRPGAAVVLLEEAVAVAPDDARPWSDLAVAYLVRAASGGTTYDLVLALSAADRAVALGPALGEARINQALALDRLFLATEAQVAWCDAVASAPTVGWRSELQRRCDQAEPPSLPEVWQRQVATLETAALAGDASTVERLVAANPQAARELVMEDLLLRWGSAVLAGNKGEARRWLQLARAIGFALTIASADQTVADAVGALDRVPAEMLPLAARACTGYVEGRRLYRDIDIEGAAPRLAEAARLFEKLRSPLALWAQLWIGGVAFHHGDFGIAVERLRALLGAPQIQRYPNLAALSHWLVGAAFLRAGRFAAAVESYRNAAHYLSGTRELLNLAGIYSLLSEALDYLGQDRDSWGYRRKALALLRSYPDSVPWQNLLRDCARVAEAAGESTAALHFENESIRAARRAGSSVLTTHSLLQRSRVEGRLGRLREALADLRAAGRERDHVSGQTLRERLGYDLAAVNAEINTAAPSRIRIDRLSLAITYYSVRQLDLELAPLLLARAQLYASHGQLDNAEVDLRDGIEIFERHRRTINDRDYWLSMLDTATRLFDEMILFQLGQRHDPAAAFAYAEKSRTGLAGVSSPPAVLGGEERLDHQRGEALLTMLSKTLRDRAWPTIVIEYTLLPHELLIWKVDRRGWRLFAARGDIEGLRRLTRRFLDQLRAGAPAAEVEPLAAQLFEQLIAPFAGEILAGAELVIVPDKFLNALPFAALWDRFSGRYVLETCSVTLCPQASLLVASARAGRPAAASPGGALLVGNPELNRRRFPWLAHLPYAAEEVSRIAALYPHATLLVGAGATRVRFLHALRSARVLHFAGHALAGNGDPGGAQLVLATAPDGEADTVSARELLAQPIPSITLAVLSACETAVPDASRTGGLFGLARPFLESGASVVGTLWRVEDLTSLSVLPSFHRHYLEGRSPSQALRAALLPLVRGPTGARSDSVEWAAYCTIQRY